jgi:hypothetical protein
MKYILTRVLSGLPIMAALIFLILATTTRPAKIGPAAVQGAPKSVITIVAV